MFDGWKDGAGRETRSVSGGITVIYSGLGEKADSVIKRIISKRQKRWIVVSSDREVESSAWSMSCVPLDSEAFYNVLEKSSQSIPDSGVVEKDYGEDDEDHDLPGKKSSRRLSKKQREIRRVLEKL